MELFNKTEVGDVLTSGNVRDCSAMLVENMFVFFGIPKRAGRFLDDVTNDNHEGR